LIRVYIQKWSKKDAPWQRILADVLKKDYFMEEIPEIMRDDYGKPYFKDCSLQFNVSHSGEYLAIAVSEHPVGIDVQEPKTIRESTFRKVVQPQEEVLIGEKKEQDFLRLWTLKESFVKAEGKGLRIPMMDYYFAKENKRYFVIYDGQRTAWTFNIEETLIENYFICVCGLEDEICWILNEG
jgi:4'-phosphopantetheinyl transferase